MAKAKEGKGGTERRSWFKFYPDDFIAGTVELSAHDTGVYIKLLARMYARDGFIENDPEALSRLCGTRPMHFKKALKTLTASGKIIEDGSTLTNKRVQKEVQARVTIVTAASQNARSRWEHEKKGKSNKNKGRSKNSHEDRTLFADADLMHARAIPEPDKKYPTDIKKDAGSDQGDYAFAGQVIRVTEKHFAEWKENFPHIADLKAELFAHDAFLADRMKPGENWYLRTLNHLRNRNAEAAAKAAEANAEETAKAERKRAERERRKAHSEAQDRWSALHRKLDEMNEAKAFGPERDALCIEIREAAAEMDKFA